MGSLRRTLGLWQVSLSGIGVILGAGSTRSSGLLVNASLPWLAARRRTPARGLVRAVELVLPSLGFLLCAWLLAPA